MRRVMHMAVAMMAMVTMAFAAGCSNQDTQTGNTGTPAGAGAAEITFTSNPETPTMGENTFDVMVMQNGTPVDDAQVSVEFFMAAMPQMNMKEMRTKADLMPMGKGIYQGKGQVMMAGNWDITVKAMRNGQELGSKKLTVTAK